MAAIRVTEAELLDELRAATQSLVSGPDDAFTTTELADALGMGAKGAATRIKRLHALGRIEVVKVMRVGIDGVAHPRPAYRLKRLPNRKR